VLQLSPSNFNGFNIACFGGSDGSIDLTISGGTPPYTILWSTNATAEDLSGLPAGYYRVSVDDADTLTAPVEAEITLTEPRKLTLTVSAFKYPNGYNISLYGACNGSVNTTVAEGVVPYSWQWSTGSTAQNISAVCAGIHTVMVTDANGCTEKDLNIVLTQPDRSDWQMGGNTGSNAATHFIGTTDNQDVVFKVNGSETMRLETTGGLRISSLIGSGEKNIMADSLGRLYQAPCFNWLTCGNSNVTGSEYLGTQTNDPLIFKTNQVEVLRLTNYGTISLAAQFGNSDQGLLYRDNLGDIQLISFDMNSPLSFLSANGTWTPLPNGYYNWSSAGNNLYNLNTGNVGIGTTSPGYRFEVHHNSGVGSANGIRLKNTSAVNFNSEVKFSNASNDIWSIGCDLTHSGVRDFFIYDNFANNLTGATRFYIDQDGRTGIGTADPDYYLEVHHNSGVGSANGILIRNTSGGGNFNSEIQFANATSPLWSIGCDVTHSGNRNFFIYDNYSNNQVGTARLLIDEDGKVGIGTVPPVTPVSGIEYRLYVKQGIMTGQVKVTNTFPFPDYVFDHDYNRMSISEFGDFILNNKHLPGMMTADEVVTNGGIELGEMSVKLLEKIEEQALYIVDLQRQIDELKAHINK
jgi:hypothetical protein